MSSKNRSSGQVRARLAANCPAITPQMPEPKFEDSQIDVVPIELRRDAVRFYISSLQRENLTLRQIITDMGKPLTPKGIGHAAKKGRL